MNHELILKDIMHQLDYWASRPRVPLYYNKNEILRYKDAVALKSKFYYTGKPCTRGHITLRRTSTGHCIICHTNWRQGGVDVY